MILQYLFVYKNKKLKFKLFVLNFVKENKSFVLQDNLFKYTAFTCIKDKADCNSDYC